VWGKVFSILDVVQTGSAAHSASYAVGIGGILPREVDHSPPTSAEVKKTFVYTSTPPIHLHGVVLN
jgi:hypothetical protein